MKIGIIIHSETGNTFSVAQKLKVGLISSGHSVSIDKVIAANDRQQDIQKINLLTIPDVSGYDAIIFGAPVRGFSLSPILAAYLSQLETLQGKKVECFVTEFFPFPWMGGNRAIRQMKNICESKAGKVIGTGIINWSSKHRQEQIDHILERQSSLF